MNLETIASRCGVSRSTVSRVINNSPNVSPSVRERVLTVLRETNFQPNVVARSLAAGSTHIIGLVVPLQVRHLFVDPFFPLIIQSASAACSAHDYTVMLWVAQPDQERRLIRQILHSGLIDGVIISSVQVSDPLLDALLERNVPFVSIGSIPSRPTISFVDVDNIGSARQGVAHLITQGCRRIGIITGPQDMIVTQHRLEGYYQAMHEAGLPVQPEWTAESDFTSQGGAQAMQKLLPQRLDAVFAMSDAMAQGAAQVMQAAGVAIPADTALLGFDDLLFAALMTPSLSTIRQPIEQMAQAAVDLLLKMLAKTVSSPTQIVLPTELVLRESTGARRAA